MNNNIGIIIQARTASTRLPKKIIKPIADDLTFFDILLRKLTAFHSQMPVIIATTNETYDDELVKYGTKYDLPVFRGSENNVLERFIKAAEEFELTHIVRVCSDNPFLDIDLLQNMLNNYDEEDYLSYQISGIPTILTHYGFFAEIVSLSALKAVQLQANNSCIEHVTNCVYTQAEEFKIRLIPLSLMAEDIRCTLDSFQDFENLKFIYHNYLKTLPSESSDYKSIIRYIQSEPELMNQMKTQIQRQSK